MVKNILEDVIHILEGVIHIFDHLENKIDRDKLPGSVASNLYLITIKSNHLIDKLQKWNKCPGQASKSESFPESKKRLEKLFFKFFRRIFTLFQREIKTKHTKHSSTYEIEEIIIQTRQRTYIDRKPYNKACPIRSTCFII